MHEDWPPVLWTAGIDVPGVCWHLWAGRDFESAATAPGTAPGIVVWEFGWPFSCAGAHVTFMLYESPPSPRPPEVMHRCIGPISGFSEPRYLPIDPLWPGLLTNTAIYGTAWWAMLFGPGLVLRWRRRRAGRCATCGYDLQGAVVGDQSSVVGVVCPECGHADDKVSG